MDDMKISLSVPATIYSFGETQGLTQNQYVTQAKLKVFYIGKTGDNRVFTKQFSDQLLQTLPGTPVVAYYDEDKDDFVGHNAVQYVFGYVPEAATISYMEEGGATFAVTDVLLFTGRKDNIGQVATKIIGKSHSLELDPGTVEYTIVRANKSIESITFTKGHFIGLSVLGDNEQPAFAGSSFFTEGNELKAFVDSFQEFKKEVEFLKSGGKLMQDENLLPIQESDSTVTEAEIIKIEAEVKTGEDCIEEPGTPEEMPVEPQVPEMISDESIIDSAVDAAPMADPEEEKPMDEEPMEDEEMIKKKQAGSCEDVSEVIVEAQALEGMEDVRENTKEVQSEKEIANSAALNIAERQELNEYRKKAKFEVIDAYSELDEDTLNKYRENHDQFTVEQLDKELAYELVKSQRQNRKSGMKVFSVIQDSPKEKSLADIIAEYKDKK